jgi:hypothetical protein
VSTAFRRRLVALVGAAALCVAVPGAALANPDGVPNDNATDCKDLPTQSKSHHNKQKKDHQGKGKSEGKGNRCGFEDR